ncbi:MAG: DUF4914 family protein [Phycisphaeraceae bacterium]
MPLPDDLRSLLSQCRSVTVAESSEQLVELALGGAPDGRFEVGYDVPGRGWVPEVEVVRTRNGVAANYVEPYMRRRDPECMTIADEQPTNKARFEDRFGDEFADLRDETFEWLKQQDLALFFFRAGQKGGGIPAAAVCPANAGFSALGLAMLQGIIPLDELTGQDTPRAVIYVAPPFRHTHFGGKQVVVHDRRETHELFSYNLYPGPSAKKGVYGMLLTLGEQEGWVTIHGSTVQVITPYDNVVTITHEGASGGGKSEMLQYAHREPDGRLLLGENVVTGEKRRISLPQGCELRPVTDDMALAHPGLQTGDGKLIVQDAEDAWFVRINHIDAYGVDPHLEQICVHPSEPLLFLSLHAVPDATCLIWEHVEDAPGEPCPNPRVVLPRRVVPDVVDGPVEVDIRSFGVRTPPCTTDRPSYGILGLVHFLPPALGWLWRLVAPRGHANPSITDTAGMTSEGVGSYWPFATGRQVDQANLLLSQIRETPRTRFTLSPNQHVGAWKTGFMPQWLAREYLARRGGAKFREGQLRSARCPLLGYALHSMQIEGVQIPRWFLEVNTQPEVGEAAYDRGARQLADFFASQLQPYLEESDLDPLGRRIIDCALAGGSVEDYEDILPGA